MPHTRILAFRDADGQIPLDEWLDELLGENPRAWSKCLARIQRLEMFGNELRRPSADSLRDGIHELRARIGKVNYRVLYFFFGRNQVVLSHGLTKEGKAPKGDIDLAVSRRKLVTKNPKKYTTVWSD